MVMVSTAVYYIHGWNYAKVVVYVTKAMFVFNHSRYQLNRHYVYGNDNKQRKTSIIN